MIDRTHDLPVLRPCDMLNLARSTAYYRPKPTSPEEWAPRRRLDALHLAYTLTTDVCIEARQAAITRDGTPDIGNTDQDRQFTSPEVTAVLNANGIRISLDDKGGWRDHVFVERLWRTIKYDEVSLKADDVVSHAKARLGPFITFDNRRRPPQSFAGKSPDRLYFASLPQDQRAACNPRSPPRRRPAV
jgi:putative transposase